jgi:hypothetical protein
MTPPHPIEFPRASRAWGVGRIAEPNGNARDADKPGPKRSNPANIAAELISRKCQGWTADEQNSKRAPRLLAIGSRGRHHGLTTDRTPLRVSKVHRDDRSEGIPADRSMAPRSVSGDVGSSDRELCPQLNDMRSTRTLEVAPLTRAYRRYMRVPGVISRALVRP